MKGLVISFTIGNLLAINLLHNIRKKVMSVIAKGLVISSTYFKYIKIRFKFFKLLVKS